jgi:hypothetical protein
LLKRNSTEWRCRATIEVFAVTQIGPLDNTSRSIRYTQKTIVIAFAVEDADDRYWLVIDRVRNHNAFAKTNRSQLGPEVISRSTSERKIPRGSALQSEVDHVFFLAVRSFGTEKESYQQHLENGSFRAVRNCSTANSVSVGGRP